MWFVAMVASSIIGIIIGGVAGMLTGPVKMGQWLSGDSDNEKQNPNDSI